jgi:hypothetical protein
MAYLINKSDGTILTTVSDGQVDDFSTDLTLIGKNYSGFGEALNENFVKLLENFSGVSRPTNPVRGQIWFDVTELKLKVYNGTSFQPVSSATISNTQPNTLTPGDLWFNDVDKQLYFFDGVTPILLGPDFSTSQGLSGFRVRTILDTLNQSRVVTLLYTNGTLLGVFSKDSFTPKLPIDGYEGEILPGFTQTLTDQEFRFVTTATNADTLGKDPAVAEYVDGIPAEAYIKNYTDGIVEGRLGITRGIEIGTGFQGKIQYDASNNLFISNTSSGRFLSLQARRGDLPEDALRIEPTSRTVKIYDGFTDSTLVTGGSLEVEGDLTVRGSMVTINSSTVVIEDKTLELANPSAGSPTDANAEDGGLILKGDYDYSILWNNGAWNVNQGINLVTIPGPSGDIPSYSIDGVEVLKKTGATFELTSAVTLAQGIVVFGKQEQLNVGPGPTTDPTYLRLENTRISTLSGGGQPANLDIELEAQGNIVVIGSKRITGVGEPTDIQDAATKNYVDTQLQSRSLVFSFDISDGISNSGIAFWLEQVAPVAEYAPNTVARVLCTSQSNTTSLINITSNLNISTDTFNTPTGVAPALIQPLTVSPLTIPAPSILVTRLVKTYQIVGGAWTFIS